MTPLRLKGKFKSVVPGSLDRVMQTARASSEWTTWRRLMEVDSALPGKHVRFSIIQYANKNRSTDIGTNASRSL